MEPEQMLEGQTQVAENPHSEYGLTDNVEPPNPIEFLASYLLKNKAQFEDRN
uniref:Dpy-30 histone methyltransferase complex regulatory subunit n=1 Tax=Aotus nancymaae TaxID=37293 RepID=A0A2K5EF03_AOTNA